MRRVLSILLTVGLVCQSLTISTCASEKEYNNYGTQQVEGEFGTISDADISKEGVLSMPKELDLSTLPQAISVDEAKEAKHKKRMYDEETSLNTVIFANEDGSRTLYSFGYPVKYKDGSGNVVDISTKLKKDSKGDYIQESSNIETRFPKNISEGVAINDKEEVVNVSMYMLKDNKPLVEAINTEMLIKDSATVSYQYDDKTTIEYTATYTGVKEDIVVSEYTGQSDYKYMLKTGGLKLVEKGGVLTLNDSLGNVKMSVGDIIVYTADHINTAYGTYSYETVKENEIYIVTMHIDEEFLKDPLTTYPIRIDPTISVNKTSSGADAIEDVTIHSTATENGAATGIYVGKRPSAGISRTLMKFPGLDLSAIKASDRITSATVSIEDKTRTTTHVTVECYVFAGNTWTEDTATWDTVNPNNISTFLSSNEIYEADGHGPRYSFNITKAVKGWKVGNMNSNKGIIFKLTDSVETNATNTSRKFASYNATTGMPSITVTYNITGDLPLSDGTMYFNNWYSGENLLYNGTKITQETGLIASYGARMRWKLNKVDGGYVLRPMFYSTLYLGVPTDATSANTTGVVVADTVIPTRCIWQIERIEDGKCLIKNLYNGRYLFVNGEYLNTSDKLYEDTIGPYRKRVWRYVSTSEYGNTSSYTMRELSSFTMETCSMFSGDVKVPQDKPNPINSLWIEPEDFTYTGFDTTKISWNSLTGKFTSLSTSSSIYKVQVTATHKVTGRTATFDVVVNPRAVLVGIEEDEIDRVSWMGEVDDILINLGCSSVSRYYDNFAEEEIDSLLDYNNDYIVAFRCHGSTAESFGNVVGTKIILGSGVNYKEYRSENVPEEIDFSNLGLVLFVACQTGYGGEDGPNLPSVAVERGAETAIGFEDNVNTLDADNWTKEFLQLLEDGQSAEDACNELKEEYSGTGLDTVVICGNKSLCFN